MMIIKFIVGMVRYINLAVTDISGSKNTLVSGTNIKTINGNSILGVEPCYKR
jgi:hypothetical protein